MTQPKEGNAEPFHVPESGTVASFEDKTRAILSKLTPMVSLHESRLAALEEKPHYAGALVTAARFDSLEAKAVMHLEFIEKLTERVERLEGGIYNPTEEMDAMGMYFDPKPVLPKANDEGPGVPPDTYEGILEAWNSGLVPNEQDIKVLFAELMAQSDEIARLREANDNWANLAYLNGDRANGYREALEPFAKIADLVRHTGDAEQVWIWKRSATNPADEHGVTLGDCQRAAAALKGGE